MAARLRVAVLLLLLATGCGGAPSRPAPDTPVSNTSLPPIDVRYGLSLSDVELAILLGIARPETPPRLEPGAEITEAVLASVVGDARRPGGSGGSWYFAGRRPGLVEAGYEEGEIGMQVAIRYDEDIALLRIVESRNLGQTRNKIHSDAFRRLEQLDRRIRNSVLAVARRNRYGTPLPAGR